ncbi:MAG: Hpt domain-containing protein [Clostridia bacterium]|nr:Hpt domain-containing protein [Clostridia bacterium]
MTIQQLYEKIGGNYEQAVRVMKKDKLIDKYVRKLKDSDAGEQLARAGEAMDAAKLFDSAHALKGVCANLGLDALANAADEITEEFRSGNSRKLSDAEVREKVEALLTRLRNTVKGIEEYEAGV